MTYDIDIALQMDRDNILAAFQALGRPKDLDDIAHLRLLSKDDGHR